MNSSEAVRRKLVEILAKSGAFGLRDQGLEQAFIEGSHNPLLGDLAIDSLAEMELCIGIEEKFGVSVSPRQLARISTLEDLVLLVRPES